MKNIFRTLARRKLFKFAAATIGTVALTKAMGAASNLVQASEENVINAYIKPEVTPEEALEVLMEGNKRFVENKRQNPHQDFVRIAELTEGQNPLACILSCADSRVSVEIIFDRGLGDLFVVRDAGNIATPEEIGSLEYGTLLLGAKVLLVLGHERCGAIKATLASKPLPGQIGSIVEAIKPAVERARNKPGDRVQNLVKENIFLQIERLHTSEVISQLVQEGKLKVVGAYYDLDTGEVHLI